MIVARSEIIGKLEDRLAGRIAAEALAAWAFDLFYEIDQGRTAVAPDDIEAIAATLDELMFADDESFALDERDLRRLIEQLTSP